VLIGEYVDLILNILETRYPEEYELLGYLASDDHTTFNDFASSGMTWISHLEGYGLISKSYGQYHFRMNVVRESVRGKHARLAIPGPIEQRWAVISERRNAFELRLRELTRMLLKTTFGSPDAKTKIISAMVKPSQRSTSEGIAYDDIFKGELYFLDLKRAVENEWQVFQRVFKGDRARFSLFMDTVNKFRIDAHAKSISEEDCALVLAHLRWLEVCTEENS
jgi:hypothetical protein